jgi:hypothetical protein
MNYARPQNFMPNEQTKRSGWPSLQNLNALNFLTHNPELGAIWRGTARRFPLRRFPYNLVYQIKPDELRVIALAHQRRRPSYWKNRN